MKRLLVLLVFLLVTTVNAAITDNLIAYWKFEASAGSDQGSSTNSHTLTHRGSPTQSATHKGGSWSAGIGSTAFYTNSESFVNNVNTFTIVCWARNGST